MNAADVIRTVLTAALPTWRVQFGRWTDSPDKSRRYVVIRPVGGLPIALVREPQFTVSIIGADGDTTPDTAASAELAVQALAAWRAASGDDVFFLQPAEPAFMATDDGRPNFDFAVSASTTP